MVEREGGNQVEHEGRAEDHAHVRAALELLARSTRVLSPTPCRTAAHTRSRQPRIPPPPPPISPANVSASRFPLDNCRLRKLRGNAPASNFARKAYVARQSWQPNSPRRPARAWCRSAVPRTLVDSERILTKLRATAMRCRPTMPAPTSCWSTPAAFSTAPRRNRSKRSARRIAENGRVIVTGCMGKEAETIRARFPNVLAVAGAHQYEEVVGAVHEAAPMPPSPLRQSGAGCGA